MASSIYNEFISQKNKGLIWDFMYKNKMFDNIPPANVNNVKQDFDNYVAFMSTQISSNDNLVDLNKKMIASMLPNLNKYKLSASNTSSIQTQPVMQQPQSQPQPPAQSNRHFVTAEEISQEKQSLFNRALQTKQEEFNNYNKKPNPEKVDFSDNSQDKPIGAEMDKMLQDAINWRQKQLNIVYDNQDQSNALNWINKDQDPSHIQSQNSKPQIQQAQNVQQNNKPKILKIGQDTNLDNNIIINVKENNQNQQIQTNKKVNFSDKIENIDNNINNNNNDFLSLLKRKNESNTSEPNIIELNDTNINQDELIKMLKEILANQSKILDLLNKKDV